LNSSGSGHPNEPEVVEQSHPSSSNPPSNSANSNPSPSSHVGRKIHRDENRITNYTFSRRPIPINQTKVIHEQLLRFITHGYHPFSIVKEEEFKNFVKLLNPKNYAMPSRKTITNALLLQQFEKCEKKVKEVVGKASAVALTTDLWTSVNNHSFIAVTAHFINEDGKLTSVLMECDHFKERHTAVNIASFLMTLAGTWNLSNKITAVVTDNAANMILAIELCKWRHVPCFAHTLNLIVQDALRNEYIQSIIQKVKG
jgi:hypothetical protein